jgi:hypothetical protein
MFKKKRKMFSDTNEVSKICATCKFATEMTSTDDYTCSKKGPVAYDSHCKHYEYNHFLKRPPRKNFSISDRFSPEDFEI